MQSLCWFPCFELGLSNALTFQVDRQPVGRSVGSLVRAELARNAVPPFERTNERTELLSNFPSLSLSSTELFKLPTFLSLCSNWRILCSAPTDVASVRFHRHNGGAKFRLLVRVSDVKIQISTWPCYSCRA